MERQVIAIHSQEQWTSEIQKAGSNKQLVVIDFTATWCGPCRFIAPVFVELPKKYPDVMFLKVDVDEMKKIAEDFSVEAMPTFVFMKEGTVLEKVVGASKEALTNTVQKHSTHYIVA